MDLAAQAVDMYDYIVESDLACTFGDMVTTLIVNIYDLGLYKCSILGLLLLLLFRLMALAFRFPSPRDNDALNKKLDIVSDMAVTAATFIFTALYGFTPHFHNIQYFIAIYIYQVLILGIFVVYTAHALDLDRRFNDQNKRTNKLRLFFGAVMALIVVNYTAWNLFISFLGHLTVTHFVTAACLLLLFFGAIVTVYFALMIDVDDTLSADKKWNSKMDLFFNSGQLLLGYVYFSFIAYLWSYGISALLKSLDTTVLYLLSCSVIFAVYCIKITNTDRQLTVNGRRKRNLKVIFTTMQLASILGLFYSIVHLFSTGILSVLLIYVGNSVLYHMTAEFYDFCDMVFDWPFDKSAHEVHPTPKASPQGEARRQSKFQKALKAPLKVPTPSGNGRWNFSTPTPATPPEIDISKPDWCESEIWTQPWIEPVEVVPVIKPEDVGPDLSIRLLAAKMEQLKLQNLKQEFEDSEEAKREAMHHRSLEDKALPNFLYLLEEIEGEAEVIGADASGSKYRSRLIRAIQNWNPASRTIFERLRDQLKQRFREYAAKQSVGEAEMLYLDALVAVSSSSPGGLRKFVEHLRKKEAHEQKEAKRIAIEREREEKQRERELVEKPDLIRRMDEYATKFGVPEASRKYHYRMVQLFGPDGTVTCLAQVTQLQAQRKSEQALKFQNHIIEIRDFAVEHGYLEAKDKFHGNTPSSIKLPDDFWESLCRDVAQQEANILKDDPDKKKAFFAKIKLEMFAIALLRTADYRWGYRDHATRKAVILGSTEEEMLSKYGHTIKFLGEEPEKCLERLCEEEMRNHMSWHYLARLTYYIGSEAVGIRGEDMKKYIGRKKNENRRRRTIMAQSACRKVGLPEAEFWTNIRDVCDWLPGLVLSTRVRDMEEEA